MALQGNMTITETGINLPAAYCRVERVEIIHNKFLPAVNIDVAVYADATAKDSRAPVKVARYQVTGDQMLRFFAANVLDTANPIKQAYVYLKTLDEYKNFVDV